MIGDHIFIYTAPDIRELIYKQLSHIDSSSKILLWTYTYSCDKTMMKNDIYLKGHDNDFRQR
jgi:hypothetical protein